MYYAGFGYLIKNYIFESWHFKLTFAVCYVYVVFICIVYLKVSQLHQRFIEFEIEPYKKAVCRLRMNGFEEFVKSKLIWQKIVF